ncbi:hypothetical protein [Streptomyces sp. NPDC048192]|uniref:hypothetical protein n=1 Tax=Streptomyces sp. NPDC048192 TaxID=3365510 RepID=UPI003723B07E
MRLPADDTREGFAQLVGRLFASTGLTTNAFEAAHRFGDGMVSKVSTGKQLPSLAFVDALVGEAQDRAGLSQAAADAVYAAYGRMLGSSAQDPNAKPTSTMHRQMLELFKVTMALRSVSGQLSTTTYELQVVRERLERLQTQQAAGTLVDESALQEAAGEVQRLTRRREELVQQRQAAAQEVDRVRSDLARAETAALAVAADSVPAEAPAGAGGEYTHHLERLTAPGTTGHGDYPPPPVSPPAPAGGGTSRRFLWILAAATVTAVTLGSVLIVTLTGRSQDSHADGAPTTTSPPVSAATRTSPEAATQSTPPGAASDPTATAEYTDAPFTLRGANLSSCIDITGVGFAGQHPTVESGLNSEQDTSTWDDLFYTACNNDQPVVTVPTDEKFARLTTPPTDAQSCQATAEQNPTANDLKFSQIKAGDKFCLVTAAPDPHVVYLQVIRTDPAQHDIYWKATSWSQ